MNMIVSFSLLAFLCNLAWAAKCGVRQVNDEPGEFIVGGQPAKPGEFPWYVEIRLNRTLPDEQTLGECGGTLIRNNWVLTAAHCLLVHPKEPQYYSAYLGVTGMNSPDINKHRAKVVKAIPHPLFNMSIDFPNKALVVKYDIGLAKIDLDDVDSEVVKNLMPICLPDGTVNMTKDCWIFGMGDIDQAGTVGSTILRKLEDWIEDDKKCLHLNPDFDPQQQVCVGGGREGGRGACYGDSGSGLQCRASDGLIYELGLTSFSTSENGTCAQANHPDIYTRVTNYLDWIDRTIKDNSN